MFSKENIFFGALFVLMSGYFLIWAGEYTNGAYPTILLVATAFGLFMAFNVGGNDVANSFGTSVGAGTLSIKQALLVAAVFEVSGAIIAGGEVTETIRSGIVNLDSMGLQPMEFMFIMMSSLFAAAGWLLFATKKGMPVSTTHSIVGGIVGASVMLGILQGDGAGALELIQWGKIGTIAISWVVSPLLGGIVAYALFGFIKKHILDYNDIANEKLQQITKKKKKLRKQVITDYKNMDKDERILALSQITWDAQTDYDEDLRDEAPESDYFKKLHAINQDKKEIRAELAMKTYLPIVAALGALVLSGMVIFKGLKHIDLNFSTLDQYLIMGMIAALAWSITYIAVRVIGSQNLERSTFVLFSWLQVFTASGFAFSHGSNDIANAIGPFVAILDVLKTGVIGTDAVVPKIAMITFGVGMVAGLWFLGKHVIETVGHGLTKMHPASGFSAELAAAGVVLLATTFGIPVSSTHILIGAILGIGLVNQQANWGLMKPIVLAWIITLPAAALLAAGTFTLLRSFL